AARPARLLQERHAKRSYGRENADSPESGGGARPRTPALDPPEHERFPPEARHRGRLGGPPRRGDLRGAGRMGGEAPALRLAARSFLRRGLDRLGLRLLRRLGLLDRLEAIALGPHAELRQPALFQEPVAEGIVERAVPRDE